MRTSCGIAISLVNALANWPRNSRPCWKSISSLFWHSMECRTIVICFVMTSKGYSGVISASQLKRSPEPSVLVVLSYKCPSLRCDGIAFVSIWRDTRPSEAKYNVSGSTEKVCARLRAQVVAVTGLCAGCRDSLFEKRTPQALGTSVPQRLGASEKSIKYRGGFVKGGYPALVFISPFDTKFTAICRN